MFAIVILLIILSFTFGGLDDRISQLRDEDRAEYLKGACDNIVFGMVHTAKASNFSVDLEFKKEFNITALPSLKVLFLSRDDYEVACYTIFDLFSNSSVINDFNRAVSGTLTLRNENGVIVFS